MPDRLRFGINPPAGVETAWGARWIIDQEGRVDEVWDRTDAIGPDERRRELLDYLNDHVGRAAQETPAELLRSGRLRWSDEAAVLLYEDAVVAVVATRAARSATCTSAPGSRPTRGVRRRPVRQHQPRRLCE